jgi:hypothetical protein
MGDKPRSAGELRNSSPAVTAIPAEIAPRICHPLLHPSAPRIWFNRGTSIPANMIASPFPASMIPAAWPRFAFVNQWDTSTIMGTLARPLPMPVRK